MRSKPCGKGTQLPDGSGRPQGSLPVLRKSREEACRTPPATLATVTGSRVFEGRAAARSRRPLSHFGRCWQNSLSKSILCSSFGFCQLPPQWVVQQRRCLNGSWPEAFGPTATGAGACSTASCCRQPRPLPTVAGGGSGRNYDGRSGSTRKQSPTRSSVPRGTERSKARPRPPRRHAPVLAAGGPERRSASSRPGGADLGAASAEVMDRFLRAAGSPHAAGLRVPSARKRSPRPTAKGLHYLQAL